MSKALSRMNKEELTKEANRYGYEVEEEDTVAELREIVGALREESEAGIDQSEPLGTPESTESDDSDADEPEPVAEDKGEPHADLSPGDNQIVVKVNGDGKRSVLWEKHRWHPGGEVFLRGGMTAVVGTTPAVQKLIGTKLIEVK